jgi:opacity protein-like surface antigen
MTKVMNKKIFLTLFFAAFLPHLANAKTKIYAGADAQIQMLNFKMKKSVISSTDGSKTNIDVNKTYQKDSLMPNAFLGIDFDEKFKFEVGYSKRNAPKDNNSATNLTYNSQPVSIKSQVKTEVLSFDFKPYKKFDKIIGYAIFGLSHYQFQIKEKIYIDGTYKGMLYSSSQQRKSKLSPGIGFGIEYKITPSFFARAQMKYNYINIKTPKIEYGAEKIRSATNLNFGAGYYF